MKKTKHLQAADPEDVRRAAAILRSGGLVAFATETVYGLGANALSADAVAAIFAAKGRPAWDPLIVHLAAPEQLDTVARVSGPLEMRSRRLVENFWPGPLTLLLPRSTAIPDAVTAGRALVGVRVPAHPAAQALLQEAELPIAAPSANRFGHVSPTTAEHVLADLDGKIDAVLDAGPCAVGVESTVLDPEPTPMQIYRAGAVTAEALEEACGIPASLYVSSPTAQEEAPRALPSPGVGIRHYAPRVPLVLSEGSPEALWATVEQLRGEGRSVGVLLPADWPSVPARKISVQRWGQWNDSSSLAALLFAGLRALEISGAEVLACPLPAPGGLRDALRDRLAKAARPG